MALRAGSGEWPFSYGDEALWLRDICGGMVSLAADVLVPSLFQLAAPIAESPDSTFAGVLASPEKKEG